ncbi:formylglycine-generating enzyme family protein [bacterium]|nr:formylglycine-generating enzyme family protein [bacterium]
MQTTEVTQGQWKAIMGNNPSHFKNCGNDCPVEKVTWFDAQEFIIKLNRREGGNKYRLPTEAEWEYSCRAGSTSRFSFGDDEGRIGQYAWCQNNSAFRTHPVAQKNPNVWGLYDMHGNVREWCQDTCGQSTDRVHRGGYFPVVATYCTSTIRGCAKPYGDGAYFQGFRLVRMP